MVAVSSWGRLSKHEHDVTFFTNRDQVLKIIQEQKNGLAFGMGRSYGDVCLNPNGNLWRTTNLNHFISFDEITGVLVCEAGVLLRDIQQLMIPRGWILPVTPGTQLVTVGGAIANDVHGKNHHVAGSFGNHIKKITLMRTDGTVIECGPGMQQDWFSATVGGLGLTGFILSAEIQLQSVPGQWLETETIPYSNLEEFFTLSAESESGWTHTVSWIDCISGGRGLFMRGNHTPYEQPAPPVKQRIIPIVPPVSLVNKMTLKPFNNAYYSIKKNKVGRIHSHYESFFYPLDSILEWNRMYGPKGFYQYQSVIPGVDGLYATKAMLNEISCSGTGSFLAVLKTFGAVESLGMLSFPQSGVTLALDFPNGGEKTEKLFERLDKIVVECGGRIYAAKDARMPKNLFELGYPNLPKFLSFRDPGISSAMSRRLMGY